MNRALALVAMAMVLLLVVSCTPGPNTLEKVPNEEGEVAGFWWGLWHGIIAPVTLVISLFNDNVHMYEVHNSGPLYNVGFLLGMVIIWGGGSGGAGWRRARG